MNCLDVFFLPGKKIIKNDNFMLLIREFFNNMRTDKTSPAD